MFLSLNIHTNAPIGAHQVVIIDSEFTAIAKCNFYDWQSILQGIAVAYATRNLDVPTNLFRAIMFIASQYHWKKTAILRYIDWACLKQFEKDIDKYMVLF